MRRLLRCLATVVAGRESRQQQQQRQRQRRRRRRWREGLAVDAEALPAGHVGETAARMADEA